MLVGEGGKEKKEATRRRMDLEGTEREKEIGRGKRQTGKVERGGRKREREKERFVMFHYKYHRNQEAS